MAGIVRLGAMAGRFTAAAHYSRDRTGPQITKAEELFKDFGSLLFKSFECIRHGNHLSARYYTLRNVLQKKKTARATTLMSYTLRLRGNIKFRGLHSR